MTREEALQRIVDNNFAGEYGFDLQILIDCMAVARGIILNSQFPVEDCISRQQAIDKMQELEDEDDEMFGCSIPEGFDGKRAIEALKALPSIQPTAKKDLVVEDCISREEVCDYIAEFVNHEYATDREHEMVELIISGIQHLPSVQPKQKSDVLDKIRAEIIELRSKQNVGVLECLDIIDKYTADMRGE